MERKGKILVVYFHNLGFPLRKTNEQMLYCIERFSQHLVFFVNLAVPLPSYIHKIHFDLIIFHDLLLCKRSLPRRFDVIKRNAESLKAVPGYRIATVQDEFTQTVILNDFLVDHDVQHIFTVVAESEWHKIYPKIDRSKVKIERTMTGYLDSEALGRIATLTGQGIERTIDIGYRATPIRHSLGYTGYLKVRITEVFREATKDLPLKVDISNDPQDAFLGDAWYRFLLSCKYMLGVESGASVLDEDGSVDKKVQEYLSRHPGASFEQVQQACFADLDGKVQLHVVGPRHLEACLSRTCQILTEGDYNGILKPFVHYIPVKKDFSDVSAVLDLVMQDDLRKQIVENAYRDIVESGKFSLRNYVHGLLESALGASYEWSNVSPEEFALYERNLKREARIWRYVQVRTLLVSTILKRLPMGVLKRVENFMKKH